MARLMTLWCLAIAVTFGSSVATPSDLVCQVCLSTTQDIRAAVTDLNVHVRVLSHLETVCELVSSERRDVCKAVVDGLTQEVLYHLLASMDPSELCVAMTACSPRTEVRNQVDLEPSATLRVSSDTCELCQVVVRMVDTWLQNRTTPSAANATVAKLCDLLSEPTRDLCTTFAPLIVDAIMKGVDPVGACTNIGLCLSEKDKSKAIPKKKAVFEIQAGPACELCELLVQTIDTYLKDNKTEAAVNATVYKVCNSLPDPIKSTCLGFAPELVSVVSQGMDPQKACTYLKLCTSAGGIDNTLTLRSLQDGPECQLCELLINIIDIYLKDNKSEAVINATIYKVCDSLSGTYKILCLGLAPQLITVIAKGLDPLQACTSIKICSEEPAAVDVTLPSNPQDGPLCEMCELLVQTIDTYLKDNKTEAAINATIYKVCNSLPDAIKSMCLGLAPQLITAISQGLDPKQACTYLKVCTSVTTINYQLLLKEIEAGPLCDLCELVIQTVDTYLKDNKTEAAINATVYKVCNSLPDPIKSTCLGFAPEVVAALAQGLDPQQACTYLKLCTSGRELLLKAPYIRRSMAGLQDVKCDVCKNALGIVDNDLYQDEGKIQTMLEDICHRLPPPTDQACLNAVDEYFPQIWENILSKGASPESICKLLGLCSS